MTKRLLFTVAAVLLLGGIARADSYTYEMTATVINSNVGTVGSISGTFTLDTAGVNFYSYTTQGVLFNTNTLPPLVTESDLLWTPLGSSAVPLGVSPDVELLISANDGGNIPCTFAAGTFCGFLLGVEAPVDGEIELSGILGQSLTLEDSDYASELSFGNPENIAGYHISGDVTIVPEPSSLSLLVVGLFSIMLLRTKRTPAPSE